MQLFFSHLFSFLSTPSITFIRTSLIPSTLLRQYFDSADFPPIFVHIPNPQFIEIDNMTKSEPIKPEPMTAEATKPEEHNEKTDSLGAMEKFFGIFKNMFGCIKNAEEAYDHAPPQLSQQLAQSTQVPQQTPGQNQH